jgi:hypothetical protein
MKKFLFLFFFCCCANATTVATMQNEVGGMIVLTDVKCKTQGLVAYTTNPSSSTGFGCWFADDNFVHVNWAAVGIRSYAYESFSLPAKKSSPTY